MRRQMSAYVRHQGHDGMKAVRRHMHAAALIAARRQQAGRRDVPDLPAIPHADRDPGLLPAALHREGHIVSDVPQCPERRKQGLLLLLLLLLLHGGACYKGIILTFKSS